MGLSGGGPSGGKVISGGGIGLLEAHEKRKKADKTMKAAVVANAATDENVIPILLFIGVFMRLIKRYA
jgi:hypothetical protein